MQGKPSLQTSTIVLTEKEAAATTHFSVSFYRKLRRNGGGPPFLRIGPKAIRYLASDLDRWLARQRQRGTSKPEAVSA